VVFSAVQIGYQLWAIPLGLYYVQESWPMLLHHGTVVVCASMSGFLTLGFRYWTPFFYGLVELSSVPLAVMNCCKDHVVLQQRYPTFYGRVRLAFAISFLYIRVVLFVPRQYYFLRDHYLLFSTSPIRLYQAYMATVWLSSFFLLNLQLYWASLIVQGLLGLRNRRTPKAKRATPKKLE
jgi:TLC domain